MNLKKEMLQSVNNEAEEILNMDESEAEARTLGYVNDDQKCNDVLYWCAMIDRDEAEIIKYRNDEMERIKRFTDAKLKTLNRKRSFFKTALEQYFNTCKGKSLSLSNGKIGKRKQRDKVEVIDEVKFFEWHQENANGEMVKVVEKPIKSGVMNYLKETGECPPGIEYVEGKPQFYVRAEEL